MFVSICSLVTIHEFWTLVTLLDFTMGNIVKKFDSEMGTRKNGRNNVFPITYRLLIYNVRAASMRIVDKLEASLWIK